MIRSTRHHTKDLNRDKETAYHRFLDEYSRVAKVVIAQAWERLPNNLEVPKYYDYKSFNVETDLSARAMSSLVTQVSGIIRSAIEKQRRRIWVRENRNACVKSVKSKMPEPYSVRPNLSSKCCDVIKTPRGKFYGYVRLRSLGKSYGEIRVPIIRHPRIGGGLKAGVIFFKGEVQLAWDIPREAKPQGDKVTGLDQGFKTVATLSDGQTTPGRCPHGHSLESVIGKLARKVKGSQSFEKAQRHRKNFVNWSINQLDFSNLKELRVEKIINIRKGVRSSRKMSHWSNPEIRDKVKRRCEELEVPVIEQSCAYRSQRCSGCGQVRKANRRAKLYACKNCGFTCDSDLNASKNHEVDLPDVPFAFLGRKLNLGQGFFWKPDGFWDFDGAEIRVPCC